MAKTVEMKTKQINAIKYRINEFFDRHPGKTYSADIPDYRYDEKEDKVVLVGKINFQDKIQSNADSDYRKVFDKFLDNSFISAPDSLFGETIIPDETGEVIEHVSFPDKLDDMSKAYNVAQEYIKTYNLDPTLSISAVFEKVGEISKVLKAKNDAYIDLINKSNNNEEDKKNENET